MGKVEGKGDNWHGHVTAVTVAPSYRRQGLAKKLMARGSVVGCMV
jgi:N-terminal acetyltransferase B complex catalytic subunit